MAFAEWEWVHARAVFSIAGQFKQLQAIVDSAVAAANDERGPSLSFKITSQARMIQVTRSDWPADRHSVQIHLSDDRIVAKTGGKILFSAEPRFWHSAAALLSGGEYCLHVDNRRVGLHELSRLALERLFFE